MKKYLFGLIVTSYVVTSIGVPVYLHYCGGELEEISYLTKATSCCGEEEESTDDGCCKNESLVLKNSNDFTFNTLSSSLPKSVCTDLFNFVLPFSSNSFSSKLVNPISFITAPPPRLQHDRMLSVTILRI